MKKLTGMFLIILLTVSLAGCANKAAETAEPTAAPTEAPSPAPTEEPTEALPTDTPAPALAYTYSAIAYGKFNVYLPNGWHYSVDDKGLIAAGYGDDDKTVFWVTAELRTNSEADDIFALSDSAVQTLLLADMEVEQTDATILTYGRSTVWEKDAVGMTILTYQQEIAVYTTLFEVNMGDGVVFEFMGTGADSRLPKEFAAMFGKIEYDG